jgi:hypothetical protein
MAIAIRALSAILVIAAVTACGAAPSSTATVTVIPNTPNAGLRLPTLLAADAAIVTRHSIEAVALAAPGAAIDGNGLIGRNRHYGQMVSPRLQLGAGAALRIGLHADAGLAINGFRAIESGGAAIKADGTVVSKPPPDAPAGATISAGDSASGAAFFMADACPAILALHQAPDPARIADSARQKSVSQALGRAVSWLIGQADALEAVDRAAPNRLLYDALAYQSCGALAGNKGAMILSEKFVALALTQTRADGVFVERNGSDTTYQAVSVRLALDLLLAGYNGADRGRLLNAWQSGAIWLGNRIMADGRIDSTGNTRTCQGGESFLGVEKKVWPAGVYGALIYPSELVPQPALGAAAARLSGWARANPKSDPCFP